MGTVLLTGLEMTRILALGEEVAMALARSRTMEALVLKRSVWRFSFGREGSEIIVREWLMYHHESCQVSWVHRRG